MPRRLRCGDGIVSDPLADAGHHHAARQLSAYTVPPEKLVFEVGDVGGGFGQRSGAYPEYAALMIAAKRSVRL